MHSMDYCAACNNKPINKSLKEEPNTSPWCDSYHATENIKNNSNNKVIDVDPTIISRHASSVHHKL